MLRSPNSNWCELLSYPTNSSIKTERQEYMEKEGKEIFILWLNGCG
jgi:hypothetical protein